MGESAFMYQVRSFAPVCVAAITRIGAPLAKAPNVLNVPTPVPISALPEITACWVSPAPWVQKISSTSPCFLKKPAFCPSSEKEFSHVPASPPAMRNLSCATAAQFRATRSASGGIANLRLSLIILRPPRHAAMQFDQLNRREFITLIRGVASTRGTLLGWLEPLQNYSGLPRGLCSVTQNLQNVRAWHPPPTDAQVIAGTILGIAGMAIDASIHRRHW